MVVMLVSRPATKKIAACARRASPSNSGEDNSENGSFFSRTWIANIGISLMQSDKKDLNEYTND